MNLIINHENNSNETLLIENMIEIALIFKENNLLKDSFKKLRQVEIFDHKINSLYTKFFKELNEEKLSYECLIEAKLKYEYYRKSHIDKFETAENIIHFSIIESYGGIVEKS